MSDPVMADRQLNAELIQIVQSFRRRRKWRHVLAMTAGAILLMLGSAVIAARLTHHTMSNTPAIGVGVGLYAAGVLLFDWGAAAGFTSRLAKWLPASIVLGVLAVLVLAVASIIAGESDDVFRNGNPGRNGYQPAGPPQRRPRSSAGSNR